MRISFRGWLQRPHEVNRDLLEGITLIDGHERMSLGFRISVPGLADLTPMDEVLNHLLKSGEVEISSYSGEGCSNPHMSTFLRMGVEEYFRDHLVGDTDLNFFLPEHIRIGADKDASRVQSKLGEDARVASD